MKPYTFAIIGILLGGALLAYVVLNDGDSQMVAFEDDTPAPQAKDEREVSGPTPLPEPRAK
ncbi:MAG: hypothetical protein L6Q71_10440, partial [Planctomycetes bacterium]|nr:hypothetical protein [Planctomycetota bacterium]